VSEFVQNLDLRGVCYSFAIASCGGTSAGTLPKLRQAIRKNGEELHAGFMVKSVCLAGCELRSQRLVQELRELYSLACARGEM
jgi:hypothetical protein